MRFIDFLVFHYALYFDKNKKLLSWSSPLQRANYVVGIVLEIWLLIFAEVFEFVSKRNDSIGYPLGIAFIISILVIMYLLDYIYDKKGRYAYINSSDYKKFGVSNDTGITISILILLFSPMIFFALMILFNP